MGEERFEAELRDARSREAPELSGRFGLRRSSRASSRGFEAQGAVRLEEGHVL